MSFTLTEAAITSLDNGNLLGNTTSKTGKYIGYTLLAALVAGIGYEIYHGFAQKERERRGAQTDLHL